MPRSFSALVLVLALLLTAPAVSATARAAAADNGIQVDPDSAPAHEYALPLDAARGVGAASIDGAGSSGAAARPPAFGRGITRRTPATATRSSGSAAAGTKGSVTPGEAAVTPPASADVRDDVSPPSGDGGGATAVLYSFGGTIIVGVAGGLVALTLRRRRPSV